MRFRRAEFNAGQLIEETRRLAGANPYKQTRHRYYRNTFTENSCLLGQAITNLGYRWPLLFERVPRKSKAITTLLREMSIHATEDEKHWLTSVQCNHDVGFGWRQSVKEADKLTPIFPYYG